MCVCVCTGAEGECSTGETEDLDIEVDVVETSEPEDLATASNRYHHHHHHHHHRSLGAGKQNGAAASAAAGGSKKKRCRETVSASSEEGDDRTPPPHDTAQASPAKNVSSMLAKCNSPDMAATECYLESVSKELWSKFHELGTEMIITKTGRYVPNAVCRSFYIFCTKKGVRSHLRRNVFWVFDKLHSSNADD